MSIFVGTLTGGTNNHQTTSEEANALVTDIFEEGIVGSIGNTSGVAPSTGAFAANAQNTPDMTIMITSGIAYVSGAPTGQATQLLRVRMTDNENVTISSNTTGVTKYDWIYISLDADKMANPAVDADDVATLVVSRSTSSTSDNGTPPANSYCIAVVSVADSATSITNGNIADKRSQGLYGDIILKAGHTLDASQASNLLLPNASITSNEIADGAVGPSKLSLNPTTNFSGGAQTISSGTYSGSSPATDVVVGKNGILLVLIGAHFDTNTDQECSMSFKLSGSNTVAASSSNAASSKTQSQKTDSRISSFALLTGLNPGTTTITAQFAIFGGSGSSSVSSISVAGIPF